MKRHMICYSLVSSFNYTSTSEVFSFYYGYTVQNLIAHVESFKAVILSIISYAPIIVSARVSWSLKAVVVSDKSLLSVFHLSSAWRTLSLNETVLKILKIILF